MKILLFLPRSNHLKILGPVAVEALGRGHEVRIFIPPGDVKAGSDPPHHRVAIELPGVVLADSLQSDWIIAVGLRTGLVERTQTRISGLRWAALDSCGDNLTYLAEDGEALRKGWDLVTTFGPGSIGYPELDQLERADMTREACRAKWNLPAGQFVVLLGTAAWPAHLGRLRRCWFEIVRYRRIIASVRRWCEQRGALLIAKTRAKHRDPSWLGEVCDRVIRDVSFHPFTTLELLRAADFYIGFASAMAIETCAVGLQQLHLHGWPPNRSEWPSQRPMKEQFYMASGGLWNCPASRSASCYGPSWKYWLDLKALPSEGPLPEDFSAQRRACERWVGPVDGKASARFLDLLEAC